MSTRVAAATAAVLVSACGVGATPSPTPTPRPTVPAPLLVQVENNPAARPQSGLSHADVVYEYLTEGGISRFSVLFLQPPQGMLGPVRSARLVSVALAKHYQAVLVFSGAGTFVKQRVEQSGVPHFDDSTANGALFRISGRVAPHNLYSDGSRLGQLLAAAHAPPILWHLWSRSAAAGTGGTAEAAFRVPVSEQERPAWTYDPARAGYVRREPDTGAFTDAVGGGDVVAATVVVQQVTVTPAPEVEDVNGATGVEQDVDAGGPAQVFTGGKEYDATWQQPATGPPRFTLANGGAAPIAQGLVWIELVPTGSTAIAG